MKEINTKEIFKAKTVALVGIMAATLTCGKLALSFLPNIEVVTLLCALYGYVFGVYGVIAATIFVCIEPLIYGIGSWFITYIIYWPMVALVFALMSRKGEGRRLILTLVALCMTVGFAVISSVVDCGFYLGFNENYLINLPIYFLRGMPFYLAQLASNAVLFPTLFLFLVGKLRQIKIQKFTL